MPEEKRAGAEEAAASPKSAAETNSSDHSIRATFPKPEEVWTYHTLEHVSGSPYAICPRCHFSTLVEVKVDGALAGKEFAVFFPIYTRGGMKAQRRPRSRFIVRCAPFDSRLQVRKIPDFLGEVQIDQPCLSGAHQ